MDKKSKKNLKDDIENRLDDFFSEENESAPEQPSAPSLEKLKTVILSIDWEITDACLDELNTEIDILMPQWQHDRYVHALLRMLKSLGRYIRSLKAQSHPDAIKRTMSAFKGMEILVENKQMSEKEKRQLLAKEIAAFKQLKHHVQAKRGVTPAKQPAAKIDADAAAFVEHQKFEQVMSDIEKRLTKQVAQLKSQLKQVQKEIDALRHG